MRQKENGKLWKRGISAGLSFAVAFASLPIALAAAGEDPEASGRKTADFGLLRTKL